MADTMRELGPQGKAATGAAAAAAGGAAAGAAVRRGIHGMHAAQQW